jgi:hypothetical protein
MTTLSSAAWVLHDLGLAAVFGGKLFDKLAVHPSLEAISDPQERASVEDRAWRRYSAVHAVSLATLASTWLVGRKLLSGREVTKSARSLTLAKDALIGGAVVTGIASIVLGRLLSREIEERSAPLDETGQVAPYASRRARGLQRATEVLSVAGMALDAGVIGVTALLAMQSAKSGRFALLSRILP